MVLAGACIPAVLFARRRVRHLIVAGHSMAPTLLPGDRLVTVRIGRSPRPGDLVVAGDPRAPQRVLVKRVHAVADGQVDLRGDNPSASTDSRTYGALPAPSVEVCLVWRYYPAARAGRVSARALRWREQPARRPVR